MKQQALKSWTQYLFNSGLTVEKLEQTFGNRFYILEFLAPIKFERAVVCMAKAQQEYEEAIKVLSECSVALYGKVGI